MKTEGKWSVGEVEKHINYLELKAAYLALQKLLGNEENTHVRIYMDDTVAVSYINNYGGRIETLHKLTQQLWFWAIDKNLVLSAANVPGSDNFEADSLSRNFNVDMEWMLKPSVFLQIEQKFGQIEIDMFASYLKYQKPEYVSFNPDKLSVAIDAFTLNWNNYQNIYLFPPFSVICRTLQKLVQDKVNRLVLIAPIWQTQVWFSTLLHLILEQSYILPKNCIQLPKQTDKKHPIRNLQLGAFILSGKTSKVEGYQRFLLTSSCSHGENQLASSMGHISKNGCYFQMRKKVIHLIHLPQLY